MEKILVDRENLRALQRKFDHAEANYQLEMADAVVKQRAAEQESAALRVVLKKAYSVLSDLRCSSCIELIGMNRKKAGCRTCLAARTLFAELERCKNAKSN